MRILPVLQIIIVNAVLLYLFYWVSNDYSSRTAYWESEGFVPSTARFPFLLITSAVRGSTSIPGLLTVDWQQIVAVIIIVVDLAYLWSAIRSK